MGFVVLCSRLLARFDESRSSQYNIPRSTTCCQPSYHVNGDGETASAEWQNSRLRLALPLLPLELGLDSYVHVHLDRCEEQVEVEVLPAGHLRHPRVAVHLQQRCRNIRWITPVAFAYSCSRGYPWGLQL